MTCTAATRNMVVMAMPTAPAVAHGVAMSVTLAFIGPCILLATNGNGPAFAHFAKSVSHVAPPEDPVIIAIVVVIVAITNAVIESPVVVLLHVAPLSTSLFFTAHPHHRHCSPPGGIAPLQEESDPALPPLVAERQELIS